MSARWDLGDLWRSPTTPASLWELKLSDSLSGLTPYADPSGILSSVTEDATGTTISIDNTVAITYLNGMCVWVWEVTDPFGNAIDVVNKVINAMSGTILPVTAPAGSADYRMILGVGDALDHTTVEGLAGGIYWNSGNFNVDGQRFGTITTFFAGGIPVSSYAVRTTWNFQQGLAAKNKLYQSYVAAHNSSGYDAGTAVAQPKFSTTYNADMTGSKLYVYLGVGSGTAGAGVDITAKARFFVRRPVQYAAI